MATQKTTKSAKPKAPKAPPVRPTLRDQFAMAALTGLCADCDKSKWTNSTKHFIASDAYALADAMLNARGEKEKAA